MIARFVATVSVFFLLVGLAPAADRQLMSLVMSDARMIAGVNVSQVMSSPFGQFLLARMQRDNQDLERLTTLTGFDPRRDLTEILVATKGDASKTDALVLARGRFDSDKIFALVKESGHELMTHQNVRILAGKSDNHAVAFLDNSIALAGQLDVVRGAIDRQQVPGVLNSDLEGRVNQIRETQHVWMVSMSPATLAESMPDANVSGVMKGDVFKAIEMAIGGITFGPTVQVSGEAIARTEKDATALADVVRFLAGLLRTNSSGPKLADVASLLDGLDIKTEARSMKIALAIPEDKLEKLVQPLEARPNRPSQQPALPK
jgi:hypothetical protein